MGLYQRRVLADRVIIFLSFVATAFGIVVLGLVLASLLVGGIGAIGPAELKAAVRAIGEAMKELGIASGAPAASVAERLKIAS